MNRNPHRNPHDPNLLLGYRWATAEETEDWIVRGFDLLGERWLPIYYLSDGSLYPRTEADQPADLAVLDDRNLAILRRNLEALDKHEGPRVGDFVEFADNVVRRFSHDWEENGLQTSDGGSWHLGNGYLSFSGSLHPTVARETLIQTDETRSGSAWFFHHDFSGASRGVDVVIPLRVFRCSLTSKER